MKKPNVQMYETLVLAYVVLGLDDVQTVVKIGIAYSVRYNARTALAVADVRATAKAPAMCYTFHSVIY